MTWTWLLPMPILLALLGAGLSLIFGRRPIIQRAISVTALSLILVVAGALVYLADTQGPQVLWIAGWQPLGISLVADRLSSLLLLVSAVICLLVLLFSLGQDQEERLRETPISIYHPTFLALTAGVSNAFLTGDLFNLYVGFEMLLFASFVLLTLGGTGERIRAGTTYVVVSLVSSLLFLVGLAAVYAATGTVNMAQAGVRLAQLPPEVQQVIQYLLLTVFGIKAAVFPLSAWLPDSYPTAPAPVTAVFAGLLTKVGVYAMIRTQTVLFPENSMQRPMLVIGILTMVIGILGAIAQSEIKRMLSFTLVSHIGYMVFGIALDTAAGLSAAIFYTAHHIIVQTTLFLVAGLIERRGGSTSLNELGGLASASPVLGALFLIPALNLAGIPPMSGFLGKAGLLRAGIAEGNWLASVGVGAVLVTSLLTLFAMAKVWNRAFWQQMPLVENEDGKMVEAGQPLQPSMAVVAAVIVAVGLSLTVLAGPLYGFTDRAARDTRDGGYIAAVLPEGVH
ncbi:multisubunit sodium/proton antiporter, MrpD subunit [Raineyella antarctica]|uniref:Multisubunit sodium/proton antiporter, MrpD subunit n=1 Tax=Raineyella antarctica TaxID=1577474 RepID=A0A1G6H1H6_9ACTN|nr:Na+/H+ antiporter subunit D [Raineyella antarctica]SDB88122.1 multisubunit sodium/proton antiporter, MrpD subunit [Raineyella antarctica]